jgi:hypothetical protein
VKLISESTVPKAEMVTELKDLEFGTGWHSRKSELGHRNFGTECPSQNVSAEMLLLKISQT